MRGRARLLLTAAVVSATTLGFATTPLAAAPTGAPGAASCGSPLPRLDAPATTALITVTASGYGTPHAELRLYERSGGGCYRLRAGPYAAWLGADGLSAHHVEGSPTTPLGLFRIGPTVYGGESDPGLSFPYHHLVCGDWWDEDPASASYNEFVHLSCGATPRFGGDSEALWRELPAYDWFAVIDYNAAPVVAARGSAIFLHVATGGPTAGCVSIDAAALVAVLRAIAPAMHPLIAIGTPASIATLRGAQNL